MAFTIERIDSKVVRQTIEKKINDGVPTEEKIQTSGICIKIGSLEISLGPKQHIIVDRDRY